MLAASWKTLRSPLLAALAATLALGPAVPWQW